MKYVHAGVMAAQVVAMAIFLHWGMWFMAGWCAFFGGYSFVKLLEKDTK
jgi:hypothetical protein